MYRVRYGGYSRRPGGQITSKKQKSKPILYNWHRISPRIGVIVGCVDKSTAAQRKQGSGVWERVFCGGADVSEHLFSSAVQPAGLLGDQLDVILAQRRVRLGLCYQVVVLHDKVQGYGLEVGQAVVES